MQRAFLSLAALAALLPAARADLRLPSIFSSHMVLQRDKPVPVWGWAAPGDEVTVTFGDATASGKADPAGRWQVKLPAQKASAKGQTLTVKGPATIEFADVLVGEVWIGSGQSNMEWSLAASADPKETIAAAKHPGIRLFQIPQVTASRPLRDLTVSDVPLAWKPCTPGAATGFSAVLYHFGVRLHQELKVPVGLINTSWGGSPIEQWIVDAKGSGGMYNAMVSPLAPFAAAGFIWYQGESNVGQGVKYSERKKALIGGWRQKWSEELPFYFVQIAPWAGYGPGALPPLWEGQAASLKIPKTGMAVVTDLVDDIKDIHPKNKKDVGNRLALWALAKDYGQKDLVYSGPLFKTLTVDGGKARLAFAHVGGGLASRDGKPLTTFEVAGADGKFVPAEATIEGKEVVVQAKGVETPVVVRFGWTNTTNPNLINKEGLPASPFQTKDWQGGTGE